MDDCRVKIHINQGCKEFFAKKGVNLLISMLENGIAVDTPCGGKGRCGKCAVQVLKGDIPISAEDRAVFNENQLGDGFRLACRAEIQDDCEVKLIRSGSDDIVAVTDSKLKRSNCTDEKAGTLSIPEEAGIAIDLGTTTIALSLIDLKNRRTICSNAIANSQRLFGADVISRIEAGIKGKQRELRRLVSEDIIKRTERLVSDAGISWSSLKAVAISGNTCMLHLLMGYDVSGLGSHPFTPISLSFEEKTLGTLFPESSLPKETISIPAYLLPGKSAFVGADIISGLYSLGFQDNERPCVLLDLGTNGEMAIGSKHGITVSSTAAGPAFEGGNISWGVAGIPGAISNVKITGETAEIRTISDRPEAVGICGTGVIEAVAELLSSGLMDDSGLLSDKYFDSGFPLSASKDGRSIVITQADIREFQLAKAAIRAGLEIILKRSGVAPDDIDRFYIAGGFGYYLDPKKAAATGLFPEELLSKCEASGNTSLDGAIRFLLNKDTAIKSLENLVKNTTEIMLSNDPDFNDLYIRYMDFRQG